MAAAESCTGGKIAERITAVSGASDVFLGFAVTYTNEVKHRILSVKTETLDNFGAVSEETAREMAQGVLCLVGADIAVSVTGIAGPGGGSEHKPVGTVVFARAVRGKDEPEAESRLFEGEDRAGVRRQATLCALELLLP